MNKILIITFLVTLLNASYPKLYSALGDIIYDNVDKIEKLQNIKEYDVYKKEISDYVAEVQKTKEKGFEIISSDNKEDKKAYLTTLRKLSKQNDFFIRSVQSNYRKSIENEDSQLFSKLINSGLLDTQEHKQEIIDYYFEHEEDINATGVIQSYLDADAKLKSKRDAQAAKYKTKKMREAEKIKRIRKNDIEAQKALEKKLQEEVNKKKLEIRQNQKIELRQ
jgi:hypothetical protein